MNTSNKLRYILNELRTQPYRTSSDLYVVDQLFSCVDFVYKPKFITTTTILVVGKMLFKVYIYDSLVWVRNMLFKVS